MTDAFSIRFATLADAAVLPAVERSAGAVFRQCPDLAWIADDDILAKEQHQAFIEHGLSWVAQSATNEILGFVVAEDFRPELHIWELAVKQASQGQGIGQKLVAAVLHYAQKQGFEAVTLTTFKYVP